MKVTVLIVNWNGEDVVQRCLAAVYVQKCKIHEVIVIDNASEDKSVEKIRKNFPNTIIVENKSNVGVDAACNQGFKLAKGDIIIQLANDVYFDENWVQDLVDALKPDNVAISGSNIFDYPHIEYHKKHPYRMRTLNPLGYIVKKDYKKGHIQPVSVGGGAMALKKSHIAYPPFPPEYEVYQEDLALCWKSWLKGYKVVTTDNPCIHQDGKGYARNRFKSIRNYEKNKIMNLLIFFEIPTLLKIAPLVLINMIIVNIAGIRYTHARCAGYWWLLTHMGRISKMRKKTQKQRKIRDKEFFKLMTHRLVFEKDFKNPILQAVGSALNDLVKSYFFLLGMRFPK